MGAKKKNINSVKHGKSGTRLYKIWKSMRTRCNCVTTPCYKNYGARGIRVCKEWEDFNAFYEWAYKNGYDEQAEYMKCTLDRIDVNGNYEPDNCRFVNWQLQCENKRNNIRFEYKGKNRTLPEISRMCAIDRDVLYDRVIRRGWSLEKATSKPIRVNLSIDNPDFLECYKKYKSKEMSMRKICSRLNICYQTFVNKVNEYEYGDLHIKY